MAESNQQALIPLTPRASGSDTTPAQLLARLGVDVSSPERAAMSLPFTPADATAGSENELATAVVGAKDQVDLPLFIAQSNYYQNILRRHRRGEMPKKALCELEGYLEHNPGGVWENSWVRVPVDALSGHARQVWERDLLKDKSDPSQGRRGDAAKFHCLHQGREHLRVPMSYLLKLALADFLGGDSNPAGLVRAAGAKLMDHFLSDNTSPETYSFFVCRDTGRGLGREKARETAKRFLLTQLLVAHANRRFGLAESGQRAYAYFAPHPPVRQKELNDAVTDSFYRELFMSPCLAGWDRGEDKHRYMHLCHQVLSRAQLNSLARLKEAGIITRNLVVLPSTSNISLANNGVHVSLGSRTLTRCLGAGDGRLDPAGEKHLGDLAIKFVEHFLPAFVGTYSAAPYRLAFTDFHPEKVLAFLPHELDYTHLRMIWRRWRKKADLKPGPLGRVTPFGPPLLDAALARTFRLRGDFVGDFRLLDYLAAVMSTDQSPALDGTMGNQERLKEDLAHLGVFDQRMSLYMLYRQREFAKMGFSGFEGRHYSLFEGLERDLAAATDLQMLITCLAYHCMATGMISHQTIPSDPNSESERRQIFFGAAIGIPTFYVRADTHNLFLRRLLAHCPRTRHSRRYPGYLRVYNQEYRLALVEFIRAEAWPLVRELGLTGVVDDLAARLQDPEANSALGRLTRGIMGGHPGRVPLDLEAREFNLAAEQYYRGPLRQRHLAESLEFLRQDLTGREFFWATQDPEFRQALRQILGEATPLEFLERAGDRAVGESLEPEALDRLLNLLIISLHLDVCLAEGRPPAGHREETDEQLAGAPIHRAAQR